MARYSRRLSMFHSSAATPMPASTQRGLSMIVVLIMLVIIGLTSVSAIRNTTSGERLTNNLRATNLAQQYAEAALRFCEAEVTKPDADRTVAALKDAQLGNAAFVDSSNANAASGTGANAAAAAWKNAGIWLGTVAGPPSVVVVPMDQVVADKDPTILNSESSSFKPGFPPECLVEKQTLSNGRQVYVITARGFSPDYDRKPNNAATNPGVTTKGSVVWLQSTLLTINL